MNWQIRGLTSIRKGLRKDDTTFLVSSESTIASENVNRMVLGEILKSPRETIFTNPEGSQSGGVPILPIRRGPNFANPAVSNFANPEGSYFANPKGSCFYQSGGVPFCQSGGVLFFPIRRGPILSIRRGIVLSRLKKTTEKKVVKGIRLIRDRLGTSDCTGNLPFIKNQTKTKQV